MPSNQAVRKITPIPRGGDLTDEDLRQIVDDFYEVRNWAALQMRMGVPEMKEQIFRALQVRLGRVPQSGPVTPTASAPTSPPPPKPTR